MQHFENYLTRANVGHLARQHKRDGLTAFANTAGFFAAVGLYFTVVPSFWLCLLILLVWAGIVDTILTTQFKRADTKRKLKSPVSEQTSDRIAELDDYRAKHTLEDRFHPKVAERIEACAQVYDQILEGLESASWRERNAGSEWQRIAEQARSAAERAMQSAVATCVGGYRPKGMPRKTWQKRVEDDPTGNPVAQKLEAIEGELKELADALGVNTNATQASIAAVLANMSEIRRAEDELDGNLYLQG